MKYLLTMIILIFIGSTAQFAQISLDDLPSIPSFAKDKINERVLSLKSIQQLNSTKYFYSIDEDTLFIGDDDPNETMTITGSFLLNSNLVIINNGKLILDHADFKINGNIHIYNTGELTATGGTFEVIQGFIYEHRAVIHDNGTFKLDSLQFHSSGQSWEVSVIDDGNYILSNSTISNGFITTGLFLNGQAQIINDSLPGEFLCFGNNTIEFKNNDWMLYWLVLFDSTNVNTSLPDDSLIINWQINNNQPGISGVPYSVSIDSCTNVNWGVISRSGSEATFSNSSIRTIGLMFLEPDPITLQNIVNNSTHIDDIINVPDRTLHLINSNVQTWSFYASSHSNITVKNCIFGELLAMDTSTVLIDNSICDGTGGYLGAFTNSLLIVNRSIINTQVISKDFAILAGFYSAFMGQEIVSNNFSVLAVLNTQHLSNLIANQSSVIFDEQLPVTEGIAGKTVAIEGTAQIIKGPESLIQFEGYKVFYSPDQSIPDWMETDGLHLNQVLNDTLALWNTTGLLPGSYPLALAVYHSLGDSISLISTAILSINTPVEDKDLTVYTFKLEQNYPNPFNPTTIIKYSIPDVGRRASSTYNVVLKVYDVLGNKVATLVNEEKPAGEYEVIFNASGLSSGIYFYKLTAGRFSSVKKMLLVK